MDQRDTPKSRELVVPAEVLADAGIEAGDELTFQVTPDGILISSDSLKKVYVESTSHCNLDCPMCVRHGWSEPVGHMPIERFERVLQGLPRGRSEPVTLAFGGFGEPLAHPGWVELLRLATSSDARIEIVTNGLLLDTTAAAAIVETGVSQVTVSVDGGDAATYERMRGAAPDGARAAVHHLLEARRRTRRPLAIGIAAVATRSSVASLPSLLDWASDQKLDFVSIGNLVPHTEEMAREVLWERASWASVFHATSWRPQVRVGRFDMEAVTRPLSAALSERGLTYPPPSSDNAFWRNRCRFAWEGMCAVSWDGRVAPCLSLLHSHSEFINGQARQVVDHVLGRLDEQSIAAIWNSTEFRAFRRRLRAFDFPPCFHCGGCPFTETNGEDCYNNPAPVCGECLWAQGIVLCP